MKEEERDDDNGRKESSGLRCKIRSKIREAGVAGQVEGIEEHLSSLFGKSGNRSIQKDTLLLWPSRPPSKMVKM